MWIFFDSVRGTKIVGSCITSWLRLNHSLDQWCTSYSHSIFTEQASKGFMISSTSNSYNAVTFNYVQVAMHHNRKENARYESQTERLHKNMWWPLKNQLGKDWIVSDGELSCAPSNTVTLFQCSIFTIARCVASAPVKCIRMPPLACTSAFPQNLLPWPFISFIVTCLAISSQTSRRFNGRQPFDLFPILYTPKIAFIAGFTFSYLKVLQLCIYLPLISLEWTIHLHQPCSKWGIYLLQGTVKSQMLDFNLSFY